MNKRLLGILIIPLFTLAYISNTNLQFSDAYWDPSYWSTTKPYEQDMSARKLNLMTQYMESWNDEHHHSHIDGAVVIRNGFLIKEWYGYTWDKDDKHVQWSVTKSFIGTLIGIAIYRGFIPSVNEYVLDYFSEYNISNVDYRKEAMTIEHLLMMSTGFAYPGDDIIWSGWMNAPDQVKYILDLPMANNPGTLFNYDTGGSHLLSAILQKATNMTAEEFAESFLFEQLGIINYLWLKDKQGINYGGHGLHISPRDMAKLGYLYLNDGNFYGYQILPLDWSDTLTETIWQFSSEWGYGQQWWTHPYLNAYSARGRYGQCIIVLPDENIVLAFTADISDADAEPYMYLVEQFILPAIGATNWTLYIVIFFPLALPLPIVLAIIVFKKRKS